jgi:hypothetical protein
VREVSAEVINGWRNTSSPPICPYGAQRDILFTFTLLAAEIMCYACKVILMQAICSSCVITLSVVWEILHKLL